MKKNILFITLMIINLANADKSRNILIFDSYHEGFEWSDTLLSVLKAELKPLPYNTELYIEHLDSKRFTVSDSSLFEFIYKKYSDRLFDLIITCDDYSLDFMIKFDKELLRNVPVVFTGINNYTDKIIENKQHSFTGITEDHDIGATLKLISKLQPEASNVLVIHDNTVSGTANKILVEKGASKYPDLHCYYYCQLSTDELLDSVEKLDKNWVILFASFHRDRLFRYLTARDIITLLASRAKVPIYAINDNSLGYGVLGGNMISARMQAVTAAHIARRILEGEAPERIPVVKGRINKYMFDYNELQKFKIDISLLPPESIIINKPQPFYKISKRLIWGVLIVVSALSVFSIFLLVNISKRKRAEVALRESEGTIRQIAENIHEAYWLRAEDRIFYVSPAFDEIFGRSHEEFTSNPEKLIDYVFEDDKKLIKLTVDSTPNNLDLDREIRIIHPSGGIRWIRYRSFPIRNSSGKIYRVAEVAEDITVRKITGDEILKAQKLESLGLLAGGIAHDFNNLLSGVMGYLDLARIAVSSGNITKIYENLNESLNVCRKAKDLTNRLLTFSKGGVPVKKIRSVNEIILSAINMVSSIYSHKIILNLPSDLPQCNIDEGLIRQVFYNVILNACQAISADGYVKIDAEQIIENRNGMPLTFLNVTIRDNGPGIKKENLAKIFDPFFTTKAMGNGLGLSAAYSIIANHDGTIRVESEEGKGTAFFITIPSVQQDSAEQPLQQVSDFRGGKAVKILWLDDEPFITKMAESILTNFGYKVVSTTSSKVALDFFTDSLKHGVPFEIVVLDLNIKGGMGGKDVLKLMLEQCPSIVAIACSGYFDDPIMSNPALYGFKYALKKPYTSEELQKALHTVLNSKLQSKIGS